MQVQASVASNTFVVYGQPQNLTMTQVISENPQILAQLGAGKPNAPQPAKVAAAPKEDDDDVPELVDTNFEEVDDEMPPLVETD